MANLDRINFWSAVNVILMIVVGISQVRSMFKKTIKIFRIIPQVLMVKSFFAERSVFKNLVMSS